MIFLFILITVFVVLVGGVIAMLVRSSGPASGNGQPATTFRESFLGIVPRPAKVIASTLLCLAVAGGVIFGAVAAIKGGSTHAPAVGLLMGLLGGTFLGCLLAIWVLCLGYVYGDASRRNMPPVLWTLVAFLIPNLLGFLLYFVLRKPLASPCRRCGQPITPEQLFCSWCGNPQYAGSGAASVAQTNPLEPGPGDAGRG